MTGTSPDDFDGVFDAVGEFLRRRYPGEALDCIVLRLRGGKPVVLPARLACPRGQRAPPDDVERYTEGELELIQVVNEMRPDETLRAEDLAARVGRENNSAFRAIVARLVRDGRLKRTSSGYVRPA